MPENLPYPKPCLFNAVSLDHWDLIVDMISLRGQRLQLQLLTNKFYWCSSHRSSSLLNLYDASSQHIHLGIHVNQCCGYCDGIGGEKLLVALMVTRCRLCWCFRLLDILAARKDPAGLTGKVLINGHPQPSNFRLMSGYVVQDDVVMGTLSIRENLRFSADLRSPRGTTAKEREAMVNKVIEELSLGILIYVQLKNDGFSHHHHGGKSNGRLGCRSNFLTPVNEISQFSLRRFKKLENSDALIVYMWSQDVDNNETIVYTISFMVNFICVMLLSYRLLIKI